MKILITSELTYHHYSMTVMHKNKRFKLSTYNENGGFGFTIEMYTTIGLAKIANEYDIMGVKYVYSSWENDKRIELNKRNMIFGMEYIKTLF